MTEAVEDALERQSGVSLVEDAADGTVADLLRTALEGQSASKAAMVDLLEAYSNTPDIWTELEFAQRTAGSDDDLSPLDRGEGSRPGSWRVSDPLTDEDVQKLIDSFLHGGATHAQLAEQYAISESSVKRLLRAHGVRKPRTKQ